MRSHSSKFWACLLLVACLSLLAWADSKSAIHGVCLHMSREVILELEPSSTFSTLANGLLRGMLKTECPHYASFVLKDNKVVSAVGTQAEFCSSELVIEMDESSCQALLGRPTKTREFRAGPYPYKVLTYQESGETLEITFQRRPDGWRASDFTLTPSATTGATTFADEAGVGWWWTSRAMDDPSLTSKLSD